MPDPTTNLAAVPPPTAEVSVRTLASDLAAIKASGGAVLSPEGISQSVTHAEAHPITGSNSHLLSTILGWLAVFLALIAVAAGAYIGYSYLTAPEAAAPAESSSTSPPTTTPAPGSGLASLPQTVGQHASLLTRRPDYTGTFPLEAPAGTLKTHIQLMREALERIPGAARTAEITPTNAAGQPLSFPGFATAISAEDLIPAEAYRSNLRDDFSMLVVRGQGGLSVAYVLELQENSAWLYAEPGVRNLEATASLPSIFLQPPGTRTGPFSDDVVADQKVRSVTFEDPDATFTYGFFKNRLVIATSRPALDQALLFICFELGSC
jgi:hypothetical protein